MRKISLLFSILIIATSVCAQELKPEKFRYIYLWDVTLSMKGKTYPDGVNEKYDAKYNIYDEVVQFLCDDIENLPSGQNREIIVCPFQDEILATWKDVCTVDGKNNIKKEISACKDNYDKPTGTNLVGPLRYVENNYVDKYNYETTIFLLTDGNQSKKYGDRVAFNKYINNDWDRKNHFSHLKIIRLTDQFNPEGINVGNGVDLIDTHERSLEIMPSNFVNYNLIEANENNRKEIIVSFSPNPTDRKIPDGVKVRVYSDKNAIIKVDKVLEIQNGILTIPLDYVYDDDGEGLRYGAVGKTKMMLKYEISGGNKFSGTYNGIEETYIVSLASAITEVEVVNMQQTKLEIKLRTNTEE